MPASIAIVTPPCKATEAVNEYEVTIVEHGQQRRATVMAASANAARKLLRLASRSNATVT